MENRSSESESSSGSPPKDPKDNPTDLSMPRADPSCESKDQAEDTNPPLAQITDNADEESLPPYVRFHMPQEREESLPAYARFHMPQEREESFPAYARFHMPQEREESFPAYARFHMPQEREESIPAYARFHMPQEREESLPAYPRFHMHQEHEIDGLEDLEPPPTEPDQEQRDARFDPELQKSQVLYSEIGPQPVCSPDPGQQPSGSPDFVQQAANVPDPGQQSPGSPDSGQQATNIPDPGQQPSGSPDSGHQSTNVPDPISSALWDRCVSFYKRINSSNFQFPFHTLLLTWPLSTLAMGVWNLEVCRMNILPYWMLVVGLLGFATIIYRLNVIYIEERFRYVMTEEFWIGVRIAESIIWVLFAIQLYLFFEQAPSFTSGKGHYYKPKFYMINSGVMLLSSAAMIGWIVVNVGNLVYWYSRRNESPST